MVFNSNAGGSYIKIQSGKSALSSFTQKNMRVLQGCQPILLNLQQN